jgi:DNA-binding transcriptional LysR family regulator
MGQLEDMNIFVRIVESGGISRAADQLGLAKSAVSRRLVDLETRLGVRLLNRTTRKSSLTEIGRSYYERAIKVVDDVAELNALTTDANTTLQGAISLAAPLSFGLSHLSPAIDAFVNQHPELTINIDFSDRQVDLIEEGLDLGFRIADLKDSNLIARKISPIKIMLCASPEYLKKYGTPKTPDDLKNHRLLLYNITGINTWKLTDKKGKQYTVSVNAKIIANNGDFLNNMAIAGHGIISSPTFISWKAITAGKLIPVLTDYKPPQPNAYAVYPQTRYLSQRTRILIDFLVERFGDKPYWDKNITFD